MCQVKHKIYQVEHKQYRPPPQSQLRFMQMSFPSGGVVNLKEDISSNEGGVGSNVEEIIQWDRELCQSKTFSMALLILSSCVYNSPKLDDQKKVLLKFINSPAEEFFRRRSKQVMAFNNIIRDCKTGWKTETSQNKKWTVSFVSEQLALLLVLRQQVEKAKEAARGDVEPQEQRTLCLESALEGGVPKNNSLKQAFRQLWNAYETPLRNYVVTKKKKESAIYPTPSLSLQLTGQCNQDQISCWSWAKCPSNCPVCIHALTIPMQSPVEVDPANACLHAAAKAVGGNGKFKAAVDKYGCYCFCQNCFGDEIGI